MPSCPTKLFAIFRYRPTSPPPHLPINPPMQRTKASNEPATPRNWAGKPRNAPRSEPRKLPSSVSRRPVRKPTNTAAIRIRQSTLGRAEPRLAASAAFVFLLLLLTGARAADNPGSRLFQAGRIAFEATNYTAALESFEAALDAGFERPALHFNIGVAAYRLGRYERAQKAFLEVARTPEMAALAHYNLGLVALARGDSADAKRWFARSASETQDERLLGLASAQLAKLTPEPAPFPDWAAYASLMAGYDDNVALVSNSDVLGVSGSDDEFVDGQFVAALPVGEFWRFDAGALLLHYRELDEFDQVTAHGGGRYRRDIGNWIADAGVQLAYGTLGGDSFQNVQTAQLQGSTDLSAAWRLRLRYRLSHIDGMGDYTGVGGTRQEVSVRLGWEMSDWRIDADFQLEDSDLRDASLSLARRQFAVSIERSLSAAWILAGQLARSHSNFDSAASGDEDRTDMEVSIAKVLTSGRQLVLRYAYADNEASRGEFDYERSRIALGLEMSL